MKFQDDISNMNTYIHTYIHTYVHTYGQAETNMPPHFFKVGGIKKILGGAGGGGGGGLGGGSVAGSGSGGESEWM